MVTKKVKKKAPAKKVVCEIERMEKQKSMDNQMVGLGHGVINALVGIETIHKALVKEWNFKTDLSDNRELIIVVKNKGEKK